MACNGIADDSKSKTTDPQGASQTEQWSTTAEQGSTMMYVAFSVMPAPTSLPTSLSVLSLSLCLPPPPSSSLAHYRCSVAGELES